MYQLQELDSRKLVIVEKEVGMAAEANLKSKNLYKIELYFLKVIPMLLAITALANTIMSYFDIDVSVFSYVGGISLLPLTFLYISSYVFKFCEYHRMFLHYLLITDLISIYDYHIGFNIDDTKYLCLHLSITGIAIFIILYLYLKTNK